MSTIARIYRGAAAASGQLLFLGRTRRVAAGEWVRIEMPGQPTRLGQVIDAGERATVVHVQQEMVGLAPEQTRVVLTGNVARTVVGRDLLGRIFDGSGRPRDGLRAPIGEAVRSVVGAASRSRWCSSRWASRRASRRRFSAISAPRAVRGR